jgi:hypothetical protein
VDKAQTDPPLAVSSPSSASPSAMELRVAPAAYSGAMRATIASVKRQLVRSRARTTPSRRSCRTRPVSSIYRYTTVKNHQRQDTHPDDGLVRSFCTALKPPAAPAATRPPGGHAASGRSRPPPPRHIRAPGRLGSGRTTNSCNRGKRTVVPMMKELHFRSSRCSGALPQRHHFNTVLTQELCH